ncbi:hypothetical protein [Cryobacterium sp. CG_9.6]|uniref:hypothetical protein n=1 Tax=Cryobacterium sp. CG_9.6 TaxID=2760710 RepID=UPI0024738374|nr:hypothetical protein [Cryobacterium sp. CG_9.6]MDH6238317.1 hypothetical protein [Cryobacterium sp. CG_9.6]
MSAPTDPGSADESDDTQPIDLPGTDTQPITMNSRPQLPHSAAILGVIGVDGHEGTGKSTIARGAARALHASFHRPFGNERGTLLAHASQAGDTDGVLRVGEAALTTAIHRAGSMRPVVLERSWLTVGSLLPDDVFYERWQLWIPTILCWADLPSTLKRLGHRTAPAATIARHEHLIERYRTMAEDRGCVIVDTSHTTDDEAIAEVVRAARRLLHWTATPALQS